MKLSLASDRALKIASLVLATIVWFFVKAVTSDTRVVDGVPLEIRVRAGMMASRPTVRMVKVTVRGTTEDLRLASRNELFAVLDLTSLTVTGRVQAAITPNTIRHQRRVRVVSVEPTNVIVRIDPAAE